MESVKTSTLKQLEQILAKAPRYVTQKGEPEKRNLDINPTTNDLYLVIRTLINDLKKTGILK